MDQRAALKQLEALVGAVVHEIRNPLFGVSALLQVLEGEDAIAAEPALVDLCGKALGETSRIAGLLDDLTKLVVPVPPRPRRVAVVAELTRLRDELDRTLLPVPPAIRPHMVVRASATDDDAERMATIDLEALRTVVGGLLRHAWDAVSAAALAQGSALDADARTIAVVVIVEPTTLALEVYDAGPPFDPEVLPRVFAPFVGRTAARGGLTLAVVHKFATQAGGTVAVRSSPAEGTRFRVTLPASWG